MHNTSDKNSKPWNDYSSFIRNFFQQRVQKISVNAGFSCPNRSADNEIDGCIYCNNVSFSPFYCSPDISVTKQLSMGIDFFGKKYKTQKYLAYFQSGTNTFADVNVLKKVYQEALEVEGVIGLIIGTRPDCISADTLSLLKDISRTHYVVVELGAETTNNKTLGMINRGHTWEETKNTASLLADAGINVGLHIIIGLPYETEADFFRHAELISELPVKFLKIHQMQVLRGTRLEKLFNNNPETFVDMSIDKYADIIVEFCERLNPEIIIERFTSESPKDSVIYPDWGGKKNFEISHIIQKRFIEKKSFQGKHY